MSDFTAVINAYLSGRRPKFCPLLELRFRDGVKRYWSGGYPLPTSGKLWTSTNDLVAIDGVGQSATLSNSAMTFTFSMATQSGAGSEMWAMAHSDDVGQYRRKLAVLYVAFFDENWQILAEPYAWQAGLMMAMPFDDVRDGDTGRTARVKIQANSIFCWRNGTHNDPYYSDRTQQSKYPGDKGLQYLTSLQRAQYKAPWR